MHAWDTVVVGSGPGGLHAAVALARAGQRVLVLEQHYLPGGFCQSFSLEGYRFSPGVRALGECGPNGALRRLWEGLGVGGELALCELDPDGLDHLIIEGERLDVPKGHERWLARLCERFPHERHGLARYFEISRRLQRELAGGEPPSSLPRALLHPLRAPATLRWGLRSQEALVHACVGDPRLRAVLAAQSGAHGLAPSRATAAAHARALAQYDDGAYYPRGGGKAIPLALIRGLRRRGGQIRLRARAAQILMERGRVTGVELATGERLAADSVIAGAEALAKLVPAPQGARERRARTPTRSGRLVSVLCAVDLDLRARGYDSGNYAWYRRRDVGDLHARLELQLPGDAVDVLFLSITTLKDPGHRRDRLHTLELFTPAPEAAFAGQGRDGPGGAARAWREAAIGDAMLAAAEQVIPGLRAALRFRVVGSPSPFERGVADAAWAGLHAARAILGARRVEDLLGPADGSLHTYLADRPEEWLEPPRSPEAERAQIDLQ